MPYFLVTNLSTKLVMSCPKLFNIISSIANDDHIKNLINDCNDLTKFTWKYNDNTALYNKIANALEYDIKKKSEFIYKTMLINLVNPQFIRNIYK